MNYKEIFIQFLNDKYIIDGNDFYNEMITNKCYPYGLINILMLHNKLNDTEINNFDTLTIVHINENINNSKDNLFRDYLKKIFIKNAKEKTKKYIKKIYISSNNKKIEYIELFKGNVIDDYNNKLMCIFNGENIICGKNIHEKKIPENVNKYEHDMCKLCEFTCGECNYCYKEINLNEINQTDLYMIISKYDDINIGDNFNENCYICKNIKDLFVNEELIDTKAIAKIHLLEGYNVYCNSKIYSKNIHIETIVPFNVFITNLNHLTKILENDKNFINLISIKKDLFSFDDIDIETKLGLIIDNPINILLFSYVNMRMIELAIYNYNNKNGQNHNIFINSIFNSLIKWINDLQCDKYIGVDNDILNISNLLCENCEEIEFLNNEKIRHYILMDNLIDKEEDMKKILLLQSIQYIINDHNININK